MHLSFPDLGRASEAQREGFLRSAWSLLQTAGTDWDEDNASRLAAPLACYTLLSIAPLLVVSVAVAG